MDYSKYSDKATAKISKYGGDFFIVRKGDEVYNEDTNEYEGTEVKYSGKGLMSNYTSNQVNGTLILQGDVKLMCYVTGTKPVMDDVLKMAGETYLVKDIKPFTPDGTTVIYYYLQLRKK